MTWRRRITRCAVGMAPWIGPAALTRHAARNTTGYSNDTTPASHSAPHRLGRTLQRYALYLRKKARVLAVRSDVRKQVTRDAFALQYLRRAEQAHLAIETLAYWTRWLPPSETPKRFDTDCYVAGVPDTQTVVVDASASIAYRWLPFDDAESIATRCAPVTLLILLHLRLEYDRHGRLAALLSATRQCAPRNNFRDWR